VFKELVTLGEQLEEEGKLPPVGFYNYKQPIRWIVHLWPDRAYLEATELHRARPRDPGRTSGITAYPLTDEASYALGVTKGDGKEDKRASKKHDAFRTINHELLASPLIQDHALREAISWLEAALDQGWVRTDPRFGKLLSKDWVSFVPENGPLAGQHLFEHSEVKAFWAAELAKRSMAGKGKELIGECAVCGRKRPLVKKIQQVKGIGQGTAPLHSLNLDVFVSFLAGREVSKRAHLGICFTCGETAAQAFNYLSESTQHRRLLIGDPRKRDSTANQVAFFWLKGPASPLQVGNTSLSMDDILNIFGNVMAEPRSNESNAPSVELSQLAHLLELPWKPRESGLRLDDYGFYLAVLSPNVGRIALRDWVSVSLETWKGNLANYLQATSIIAPSGNPPRPHSISALLKAIVASKSQSLNSNPNFTRGLLRTAYLGHPPPHGLLEAAVSRVRIPAVLRENWRIHAIVSAIKLALFYRKEEIKTMEELNPQWNHPAYLCGRLLAILEQAQLRASNFKINQTIVDRSYGAASTAPKSIFSGLIRLATVAHLPKAGRDLNEQMEEVMGRLDESGGFPKTLTLAQQAEFALGFYHQRAAFRAGSKNTTN